MFAYLRMNLHNQRKHYSPQTTTPHVGTSSKRPGLSALLSVAPYQVNASPSHMAWTDFAALHLLFKSGHIIIIGCGSLQLLTWTGSSFSEQLPTNPTVCPSSGVPQQWQTVDNGAAPLAGRDSTAILSRLHGERRS